MITWDGLARAAAHPNVIAFSRVIRQGETNQDDSAFTLMNGGAHFDAPPWVHPAQSGIGGTSTASGAYQIVVGTWGDFLKAFGDMDFSPENQFLCYVWRLDYRHALEDVFAGRITNAIAKLAQYEWTSLQLSKNTDVAPAVYQAYGGTLADDSPDDAPPPPAVPTADDAAPTTPEPAPLLEQPQGETHMGVFAALLPEILQSIPSLISVFGSPNDSEVAKRNQAAGVVVADTLVKATNAVNLQDAVTKIQSDDAALKAATLALEPIIVKLTEVGGGLAEARKAAAVADGDWRKVVWSFPFILAVIIMPLVYAIVIASLVKASWLTEFTNDQRMFVWSFIIGGAFGAIVGFVYGTTIQSAKKDDIIAGRNP